MISPPRALHLARGLLAGTSRLCSNPQSRARRHLPCHEKDRPLQRLLPTPGASRVVKRSHVKGYDRRRDVLHGRRGRHFFCSEEL